MVVDFIYFQWSTEIPTCRVFYQLRFLTCVNLMIMDPPNDELITQALPTPVKPLAVPPTA